MGIIGEEIGRYDPYTDKFIKNTTTNRIEVGTDGNPYRLLVSNNNEYLPKDELYTKADMVAMLEDLKDKMLFEHTFDTRTDKKFQHGMDLARRQDLATVQEKINALRGEEDGNDNN